MFVSAAPSACRVWGAGHRLEPFDDYAEALIGAGVEPPFPRAFENASFVIEAGEVEVLLKGAGFSSVDVSVVDHTVTWPDAESATAGILSTPFGPLVSALAGSQRAQVQAELERRLAPADAGEPVRRVSTAVIALATVPTT